MYSMKNIGFYLLTIAILVSSCEKTVSVVIPQKDPKLVINSWMGVGEIFTVGVSKSRNILQPLTSSSSLEETYSVKNAIPVLYEDGTAIDTLVFQPAEYVYKSVHNKKVALGKTYSVKVTAGGYSEAEAMALVPSQSQIAEVKRIKNAKTSSSGAFMDELTIKLNDPAAEKNFYLIQVYGPAYGSNVYTLGCVNTTDKDLEATGADADPTSTDNCYDGGKLLMKDVNFNGGQKVLKLYVESSMVMDYRDMFGRVYRPFIKVHRITEEYFKYLKSFDAYYNGSDNPFAEPVNVYTNVKNGFGIFSTYTSAVDTLR